MKKETTTVAQVEVVSEEETIVETIMEKRDETTEAELVAETVEEPVSPAKKLNPIVSWIEKDQIQVDTKKFQIVENYREAFDLEKFQDRYSDILDKYDYIVGDWGFEQLRLKGFYLDEEKVRQDQKIQTLVDYLYEYCNFGCAFFVLARLDKPVREEKSEKGNYQKKRPYKNNRNRKQKAYTNETRKPAPKKAEKTKVSVETVNAKASPEKRHFTIRNKNKD